MRADEKTYQLIEDYLNKQLSGSEAMAFEKEMQSNPDLKHQVKLHQMANELVVENRLLQVKDILLEQKPSGVKSIWKYIVGGIAGALVITGIVLWSNQPKTDKGVKDTAIKNTAPVPDVRSDNNGTDNSTADQTVASVSPEKKSADPVIDNLNTNSAIIEDTSVLPSKDAVPHTGIADNTNHKDPADKTVTIPTSPADPCHAAHITAHVSSNPACAGEEDGSILVNGFKGGHAPYHATVYDSHNEVKSTALKLSAGTYSVEIKDAKGCSRKLENVVVAKKTCPKDYHFNPFVGESWTIPASSNSGKLLVYNDLGSVIFEKELTAGSEEHWNGESKNGEINPGYFIFVIKYKDGSQLNGSVTIVR